jgi:hypothetical protein
VQAAPESSAWFRFQRSRWLRSAAMRERLQSEMLSELLA